MDKEVQTIAIFFSKNRALQLDACLRSFVTHCQDVRKCCQRVIYTSSSERYEKQYKMLSEVYKEVVFIREDSFQNDLVEAMDGFSYVLFVVDDNIFVRPWSIGEILKGLRENTESIGFSLRLGRNTTLCYSHNAFQKAPIFEAVSSRILKFNWTTAQYDFGYPLEVSSSIYRTRDVLPLISQSSDVTNPNRLEVFLDQTKQRFFDSHPELLCFATSVSFCNPANTVQPIYLNRFGGNSAGSVYSLGRHFDLGYRINLAPLANFVSNACHQEIEFEFIRPHSPSGFLVATVDLKENVLSGSEKSQEGHEPESQEDFSLSCTLEMSRLDVQELELVLKFIDWLKIWRSTAEKVPWLLQVLRGMADEKHDELAELAEILDTYKGRLSEILRQYHEQEQGKKWLEDHLNLLHQKLQSTEQAFQNQLSQMENLATSRTYKLATIFRDARHSKRLCLLFPLRFTWFFLRFWIKTPMKNILYRIQKTFYKQKKQLWDRQWPKDKPLVSVVIPCYNYGQYVEEAIDSVLSQTWQDLEIIVVDDGSDDPETVRILDGLRKPKTQVIRQKNLKLSAARNRGIRAARGKYVCCLDADDKIAPTYLERCLYRLETEGLDICGSWQQNFENDDSILKPGQFSLNALLESNCMINAALFRPSLWHKIGGYDEKMTDGYEDWEFWIRMAAAGARATVIPEPLFFYRKHGQSMIDATLVKHDNIVEWIRLKHAKLLDEHQSHDFFGDPYQGQLKNGFSDLSRAQRQKNGQINILIAMPYLTMGGAERVISQICCNLSKRGFNFTIFTTSTANPEWADTTSWFKPATEEIYHLRRFLPENQWKLFIFDLLRTRNIQILWQVGSSFVYDFLPEIKTHFNSVKIVDLLFNEVGHTANNRKYDYCIDLTIAENRWVHSWLLAQGADLDRVKLIENGVDLEKYKPWPHAKKLESIPSESNGRFIVGYFGRFSGEKGVDVFVEIASQVRHRHDIHFVMGGDGPLREQIDREIKTRKLQDRVQLLGIVDVSEHLPRCDVVVVPSRVDGRPNIVLESLATGIPVVASKVGGLCELVSDGHTGFLCNSADIEAFVSKITLILDDTPLREKMKLNTRKAARKELDIQQMFHSYASVFRNIATQPKRFEV